MKANAVPWLPKAFGWPAAHLTWPAFFCRDIRRRQCLALSANAALIACAPKVPPCRVHPMHFNGGSQ